jgi:hypothetical protein
MAKSSKRKSSKNTGDGIIAGTRDIFKEQEEIFKIPSGPPRTAKEIATQKVQIGPKFHNGRFVYSGGGVSKLVEMKPMFKQGEPDDFSRGTNSSSKFR